MSPDAPPPRPSQHPTLDRRPVAEPAAGPHGTMVYPPPGAVTAEPERDVALFEQADRYQPGALIGRGGMGEVRLYKDERIGREVAIKTLQDRADHGSEEWKRFVREARVQGQLEHPAIVPVYDFGVGDAGQAYFSMRRVQGESLANVLDRLEAGDEATLARWSRRRLLSAFVQVCLAVDYAHSRGVVHRDLKPGNVMVGDFGEVQVIDWGLALVRTDAASALAGTAPVDKPLDVAGSERLTVDGSVMGTPAYMSPEQMGAVAAPTGPASDVFALGLILYELLTFRALHGGRRFPEIWARTRRGFVPEPARDGNEVPEELDAVCKRATRIAPAERYATARELADAVESYLDRESDRARKRDLANEHGRRALETVGSDTHADEAARQRSALREALAAIALDPEQREARSALAGLLGEAPQTLPAPVERELEDGFQETRRRAAHLGMLAWAGWLASAPLAVLLGVRHWWVWFAGTGVCAAGVAYSAWLRRQARLDGARAAGFAGLFAAALMIFSAWLGPFVFVPGVTSMVLFFGVANARPRERKYLVVLAAATVMIPWVLELAGAVPPSMAITAAGVRLLPRAFDTRPLPTVAALVWTSLSFVVLPIRLLAQMRDALRAAERRLALHAWQLRQLVD